MAFQPNNATLATIDSGQRVYSTRTVVQCRTCRSPLRHQIEESLIEGLTPRQITERLPEEHAVSQQSIYRHFRRGHLPVDEAAVLERRRVRAEHRWKELGRAATTFMATEVDVADSVIRIVLDRIERGEIKLTTATLLKTVRFLRDIETRELEAETGRARLADLRRQMARILDIVGDELGPAALDQVYVTARADHDIESTLWADEFAHHRQQHVDYIDHLSIENPPERWDPLAEIRESHLRRRHPNDGDEIAERGALACNPVNHGVEQRVAA